MDWKREDRIYDLQQALAALPPRQRATYLDASCAGDPALRQEVMERQRKAERTSLDAAPRFTVTGVGKRRDPRGNRGPM
jgi:hypothetical protein